MSSNKEDQTARRRATQDVIAANRPLFEERMRHYYAEMNLGEWTPRLSAEERKAAKEQAEKEKAAQKIRAMAAKAGIGVLLVEDPDIEQRIEDVKNGVGVQVDWHGDQDGFSDEAEQRQRRQDEEEDAANEVEAAS